MSCSRPNLQNIPRDPAYRACFRPQPGRVLVKADFSQIELRIAAQLSQDPTMLAAFRAGEDFHTATAARVLGVEPAEVTLDQRQLAKCLNFGLLYGAGAPRLKQQAEESYGVSLSLDEADELRRKFFRTYRYLQRWQAVQGNGQGETRTLTGRRRVGVESYTERLNSPVQGAGADLLKLALGRLYADRAAYPSAQIVNVIHDEILVECDAGDAHDVEAWLPRHMEAAGAELLPDVRVVAEASSMADWGGAEVLDGFRDDEPVVNELRQRYNPVPSPQLPDRRYRLLYADPPWSYRDEAHAGQRGAVYQYPTMTTEELCRLRVAEIASPDAVLFLWSTWPLLPDALRVMAAWGFEYKTTAFVWLKTTASGKDAFGMGHYTRANTEPVLLGVRGKMPVLSHSVRQVVRAERRRHSEKPGEVRDQIVTLYGDVARIELFARERVSGWEAWGLDVER
jgi:N6-adenosine-specific RNA methylase IME4